MSLIDEMLKMKTTDIAVLHHLEKLLRGKKKQLTIDEIARQASVHPNTARVSLARLEKSNRIRREGPGCRVPYKYEVINGLQ